MVCDPVVPVILQSFAIPRPVEVEHEFREITEDLVNKGTRKSARKEPQLGITAWSPM
jgi:hypothetical protein